MVQFEVNALAGLPLEEMLQRLSALVDHRALLPDRNTPVGETTHDFFENNWIQARDGLLARTERIRVEPLQSGPVPYQFRFEIDRPYKSKTADGGIELVEGPIRGMIRYRPDLYLAAPDEASIVVLLDRSQHLFHANHSRRHGILCVGDIPTGPYLLEHLLLHLFSILSYQNWSASDPADLEAARYFATDPEAMSGLEVVEPLY